MYLCLCSLGPDWAQVVVVLFWFGFFFSVCLSACLSFYLSFYLFLSFPFCFCFYFWSVFPLSPPSFALKWIMESRFKNSFIEAISPF